jgi:hypothetical protein
MKHITDAATPCPYVFRRRHAPFVAKLVELGAVLRMIPCEHFGLDELPNHAVLGVRGSVDEAMRLLSCMLDDVRAHPELDEVYGDVGSPVIEGVYADLDRSSVLMFWPRVIGKRVSVH